MVVVVQVVVVVVRPNSIPTALTKSSPTCWILHPQSSEQAEGLQEDSIPISLTPCLSISLIHKLKSGEEVSICNYFQN